ncbi:MAG: hypothetical protein Q7J26_13570 [Brevundimonas sp.]|uniref:hypothetical protein n=1 Tax=Brevundimonas sp. TaxID=1871086 RepID=UPI00271677CE|nr:hypothetical protein [Brevundimonas sp.]MDO9609546.1 hypothetical protein [Brevundimonas sp.]
MFDLPVFGLDAVVWEAGWRKVSSEKREKAERDLIARPAWVIDGVSARVREAADAVIFLDMPRRTCLLRCARRNWRYLFRSRPGLPDACPEILIVPQLVSIIRRFPGRVRPGILSDIEKRPDARFHVVTAADRTAAIQSLSARIA